MKRSLFFYELGGYTFSMAFGTILHFLYEFTGSVLVTPISAVNESTFEHMKILFFPMLFYAIFEWFFLKEGYKNFWTSKLLGTLLAVTLIPVLFYTFQGSFGEPPAFLNIIFFFLSGGVGYFYESKLLKGGKGKRLSVIAFMSIIIIAISFSVLTYFPPKLPLFLDPIYNVYGLV